MKNIQILSCFLFSFLIFACKDYNTSELLDAEFIDPDAPVILSPVDQSSINDTKTMVFWSNMEEANSYEVHVAVDPDFVKHVTGSPFIIHAPDTFLELTPVQISEAVTYYIRVRVKTPKSGSFSVAVCFAAIYDTVYVYCPEGEECDGLYGAGNKSDPLRSINRAVNIAENLGIKRILVAKRGGGEPYNEEVGMSANISIYGGYNSASWQKDAPDDKTKLTSDSNITVSAVSIYNTGLTVLDGFEIENNYSGSMVNATVSVTHCDNDLVIQNCKITAGKKSTSSGISIYDSKSVIQYNTINGSMAPFVLGQIATTAVEINSSEPLIQYNDINGEGSGFYGSFGISILNPLHLLIRQVIRNNNIHGGRSMFSSVGVYAGDNVIPEIYNNEIIGGEVSSNISAPYLTRGIVIGSAVPEQPFEGFIYNNQIIGGTGGEVSVGIDIINYLNKVYIRNNTIDGGHGTVSYGIYDSSYSMGTIFDNNIIFVSGGENRICIYDSNTDYEFISLKNNLFYDCPFLFNKHIGSAIGTPYPSADCNDSDEWLCINNAGDVNKNPDLCYEETECAGNVYFDNSTDLFADIDGLDDNILTMNDNDWNLSVSAPVEAHEGGLQGAVLGWFFNFDADNCLRSNDTSGGPSNENAGGWSIGAFEYNAVCE